MSDQENILRAEAEAKLGGFEQVEPVRSAEVLLHELQVHQIELEMQNENLRQSQIALEESRDRYADLYDFAPVGYLTLNVAGMIVEANFTSADLFGLARKKLLNGYFSGFVACEDRERWRLCFLAACKHSSLQRCELAFMRADSSIFYAQLECVQKMTAKGDLTVRMVLVDITVRRQADLALRENEAKLRGLYDLSPLGIALTDMQGKYIELNSAFAVICGYSENELKKLDYWTLTPREYEAQERCQLDALQLTGRYGPYEKEYIRKDGQRVPIRLNGVLIKQSDGQQYIWSIVEDITAQRHERAHLDAIDLELRESRQLLEAVVENIPVMVFLKRASDLRYELFNRAGEQLVGSSHSALLGKGDYELWPSQQADSFIASDRLVLASNEVMEIPEEIIAIAGGETRYLHTWKIALRNQAGIATHLLGISVDITARKQADTLLRESEEKFRVIFEAAIDGIVLLDAKSMHFVSANSMFCRMLGYSQEEIIGMKLSDIHRDEDLSWVTEDIQGHLRGEVQLLTDIPVMRRNGLLCYADIKSAQITLKGNYYFVVIFHDNSPRRKVEQELREYQQLLRELAAQGATSREAELKHIAREVHDELGQILTALRMDISLLRIQFGAHDSKLMSKIQDMLGLLDKAIQCARDVTANLHPPALDLGIVSAITWLADEFTMRTAIPCAVRVNDEPMDLDNALTLSLFRIVQESLTNITRYARASAVEIILDKRDQVITVEINDDGTGFSKDLMPAVKTYGLMGMRERALASGGKVEIRSAQGQGTTVHVEIPLTQVNPGRRIND